MTNHFMRRVPLSAALRTAVAAFVCGALSTFLAGGLVVRVTAQAVPRTIVDVCADAEGTLRLTDPAVPCAAGERRLRLRQPEVEKPKEENQAAENRRAGALDDRLKRLEEKVSRRFLTPSRVVAPFEVVTENDQKILRVEEGQTRFFNAAGKTVARIVANENGGYLETVSGTKDLHAVIGTSDQRASVLIVEGSRERISLGRSDNGGYGLRVNEPGGKTIAGIGEARVGGGGVVGVGDKTAEQRARIFANPKGGGILEILNGEGQSVATLSTREQGSGLLQVNNGSGVVMVEAGVTKDDIGVVIAGPAAFQPSIGFLGLPGSYIQGKAK
jgi:hypothetical protein